MKNIGKSMGGIKGWSQVANSKNLISWTSGKPPFKVGDVYTFIEFIPPSKHEIGYLYIARHTVNWVDGMAWSPTVSNIYNAHPKTRKEGITIATNYMKGHK